MANNSESNMSESNMDRWVDDHLAKLDPASNWQPDITRARARLDQRRANERTAGRKATWTVTAVLAGCAGLLAFPASRGIAQRCVGACESLFVNRATMPQVSPSQTAPDFSLKDASGADIRLSDYKGKVVLLNFWATWCPPCKAEIPWFEDFQRTYGAQGLVVIGISMDEDGWQAVRPYMHAAKIDYRVAIGDDALAQKYGGVESLPETLLIDRDGRVGARHVGIVSKSDYEGEIVRILAK
jgi:cytochrome c biogenesis protein CcmG/thiol:disulfide interchange protein DsbE